jgi:DeoR/GlpR family transcriptional regulator of sugar metabolism
MKALQRHDRILQLVGERGIVFLASAIKATGASIPTIRRDFERLAAAGSVERVRGGVRVRREQGEMPFNMRAVRQSEAKSAIARKAASLIRAGQVLLIDGGTTTYHICYHLPRVPLRIITNSLRLASYLDDAAHRHAEWEVYLTGGMIHHGAGMLAGPGTLHSLDFYHADWAFLSIGGITADGLYNTSEAIVETERKMIQRCDRAIILADQSKVGRRAMCRVCGIGQVDRLITNRHAGKSLVEERLANAGLAIDRV